MKHELKVVKLRVNRFRIKIKFVAQILHNILMTITFTYYIFNSIYILIDKKIYSKKIRQRVGPFKKLNVALENLETSSPLRLLWSPPKLPPSVTFFSTCFK